MHLEFTEDQDALRASVREVLAKECPPAVARERAEKGSPAIALWSRAVDLGWPALTLPEDYGGLGLGAVEATVVAEELGRSVAPIPWLATTTQYAAVVRATAEPAQLEALLPAVADGRVVGTLAVAEDGVRALPAQCATTAEPTATGWRLRGTKSWVWEASLADEVAVVARTDEGLRVFVVPARALDITPAATVDATREWATVRLDDVEVEVERALGTAGRDDTDRIRSTLQEATTAVASEMVGTCAALFELTVSYVSTREQFGVPVGSFQAVKHKLADSYVALERARAAAYFAAATLAEDDSRRDAAVSMAKVAAGDCQRRVVQDAIQCFGGIGYTWESDVHLYAKRAKAGDAVFGTAREHRRALARLLGLGSA